MSQLISDAYLQVQKDFHEERPDYGVSSGKYVEQVRNLCEQLKTRDVLDYGCGKALLAKGLPFPIQSYDPAISERNRKPEPADIVVCTDVMEHIEPACVEAVIADLRRLTGKLLLMDVACHEAKKFLPDGRNAHISLHNPTWWLTRFLPHFDLHSFQRTGQSFVAVMVPLKPEAPSA